MKETKMGKSEAAACSLVADFFRALADETRLKILFSLFEGAMCVMHISERVEMSQSAVSHQLAILKRANLVKVVRYGKKQVYSLADEHIRVIVGMAEAHMSECVMSGGDYVES